MRFPSKLLLLALFPFALIASKASTPGAVGQYAGQTVTCSSDDGKRHYCDVDTRGGVRLSRQISGSACIETQSWGYDSRGIWVDRGCRAEFVVGESNRGAASSGQTITCSSDTGGRNYCPIPYGIHPNSIVMVRQISKSACIQNQTWGVDQQGIWVDRGCRAEFSGRGGGGGGYGGQPSSQTFTCASNDGRRNYCSIPSGINPNSVTMTRQISDSACIQGQTWGIDQQGVWVDRGCRAEFSGRGGGGRHWGQPSAQTFTCASDDGRRNYCSIPSGINPNRVIMTRQISGSACIQGQTWGVDQRGVWVDRGCRAEFGSN